MFVVLAPIPQRAGGDSWQLLRAFCGLVGCPPLGRNTSFPPSVAPVSPSKWDLSSSVTRLGKLVRCLPLPPPLCGHETVTRGDTVLSLSRSPGAELGCPRAGACCALHSILPLTPLLSEKCLPPSPEQSRALGGCVLSVTGCAVGSGRAFTTGSPGGQRGATTGSPGGAAGAGRGLAAGRGQGGRLFVPCVVFSQVTQLSAPARPAAFPEGAAAAPAVPVRGSRVTHPGATGAGSAELRARRCQATAPRPAPRSHSYRGGRRPSWHRP